MPDRDAGLIRRFKEGDTAAFDELFARHADRLYGFGFRMCGQREDAQDVVQDTFLAAFKGLKDFRGRARLTTWLYKIASSACIKKRRRKSHEPKRTLSIDALMPDGSDGERPIQIADWSRLPADEFHRKQLREALNAAVAALPKEDRLVLVLRDMEKLSAREAAKALGLSVPAVKSRLHRARLFIRKRLQEYDGKN